MLVLTNPRGSLLRLLLAVCLAACLVWAAYQERPSPALLHRLNAIQQFLQQHEQLLPARGVWLVWLSLFKLSHGDVLASRWIE